VDWLDFRRIGGKIRVHQLHPHPAIHRSEPDFRTTSNACNAISNPIPPPEMAWAGLARLRCFAAHLGPLPRLVNSRVFERFNWIQPINLSALAVFSAWAV
jgi:hypothetical protein